jgi:hypothetical protein
VPLAGPAPHRAPLGLMGYQGDGAGAELRKRGHHRREAAPRTDAPFAKVPRRKAARGADL